MKNEGQGSAGCLLWKVFLVTGFWFLRGRELPKTRVIGHEYTNDDYWIASFVHWWQKK
jgi:hypothetical protein